MEDIQRERFALDGEKPKKPWQLFTDRGVRWQLITVIVMTMGQQLSGINAVSVHMNKQLKKLFHFHLFFNHLLTQRIHVEKLREIG